MGKKEIKRRIKKSEKKVSREEEIGIQIPFCHCQAKKIDIKRLKGTFWRILTTSDTPADVTMDGEAPRLAPTEAAGTHSFHKTIALAKSMLPSSMAENLRLALIFCCGSTQ